MSSIAVILVIFSALLHALKSFFTKQSTDKQVFLWCYSVVGIIFYTPICIYYIFTYPPNLYHIILLCTLTGFIRFLYNIFFTKSYEEGDLSLVYPIMRSAPALVLIFAVIFLEESVTFRGVLGIALVIFGVYVISLSQISSKSLFKSIKNIFSNRATIYAFLTMLTVTAYSLVDKIGVNRMHPLVFSYFLASITVLFFTPYVFIKKPVQIFKQELNTNWKSILINGVISQGGYILILIAFTFDNVSYVVGLRQTSIIFAVLLGGHLLKEKGLKFRLLGALVIFIGSFLIATA